jgi:hypothetical protein
MSQYTPQVIWFLQSVVDVCPEYAQQKGIHNTVARLGGASVEEAYKHALWIIVTPEPYAAYFHELFGSDLDAPPVETLVKNGYFLNGKPTFLKDMETKLDIRKLRQFLECIMWAFLDRRVPRDALKASIGQTRATCCKDAEASLCMWINTIVKPHLPLPRLSSITRHFFGLAHFRVLLFHFLRDQSLMDVSPDPKVNAKVGLSRAAKLDLRAPFPSTEFQQSPLIIMCFLCRCVVGLANVSPPTPGPAITGVELQKKLDAIEEQKKVVSAVTQRVGVLSKEVQVITAKLSKMKRPTSSLLPAPPPILNGEDGQRPQTSMSGQSAESKRVTWDLSDASQQEPPPDAAPEPGSELVVETPPDVVKT